MEGQLFVEAFCMRIQGNGASFRFPPAVITETCDHFLRIIGMGKLQGEVVRTEGGSVEIEGLYQIKDKAVEFSLSHLDVPTLITVVIQDSGQKEPRVFSQIAKGPLFKLDLGRFLPPDSRISIYLNERRLNQR